MMDIPGILIESTATTFAILSKSLPPIVLGLILAELIMVYDAAGRIAFIARPITRFSHLSDAAGASFILAFFSAASANSMLAGFYRDGIIEKRELFVASLVNSFPATTMHWRSLLPVLIPLLGFTGLVYFGLLMLVGLLKTAVVMVAGRLLLDGDRRISPREDSGKVAGEDLMEAPDLVVGVDRKQPPEQAALERTADASAPLASLRRRTQGGRADRLPLKVALKRSWREARPKVARVVKMTTAIMFLVSVLIQVGAFDLLALHLSGIRGYLPIPAAGLGIIAAQFGGYIAAYTVAGGLLAAGELSGKEVVVTLMMGNVITSAAWAARWLIPSHAGIFGPRIGTQLVICSTGLRNVLMLTVAFAVWALW
ncbi:hypothetical protein [Candidatus Methanocrinis natronophilus]|uniref:Nucleoside recognition protein n=1 Tax=Candidatus Methanocrinis natronophilus TaxID=3033396 RepID=A0ABT5X8A7_9EURY|nr:hypothetical protein [Candidatus Methanocrinis natronophilus]MDF0590932.1 hypothetical protein [Candidatus Methanocrinis natronophilus]